MEKITLSENGATKPYITYLYEKMKNKFNFLSSADVFTDGTRSRAVFTVEGKYGNFVRKSAKYGVAEVIAIGYKYAFFEKELKLPLLDETERKVLLTALVSADLSEDIEFIVSRLSEEDEYCIDGTYNFRLDELKESWKRIAEYVPPDFSSASLESFVDFLIGENTGKAFLREGILYDEEYRPQNKSTLIEKNILREILLSGAGNIYCFGQPDKETETFLKKYYKEKVVFC